MRNLPLPDDIDGLGNEVRRVRGDDISDSSKESNIVRVENRNQVSTYCPYATSTRSFTRTLSESKDDDDDERQQQQMRQQQQTYKLSLTAASRLLETELSRKFKLTDSVEGEIVFAVKLLAARHFAYFPTRNETNNPGVVRDAMIGVYLGSCKDVL